MRVLWLSHVVPYPPTAGVLLRAYNLLKGVSDGHEVDLVAFVQRPLLAPVYPDIDAGLAECHAALLKICRTVTFLLIDKADRPAGRLRTAASGLFSRYGYVGSWLYSRTARKAILAAMAGRIYDVAHFDSISLSRYRDLIPGVPASLGHHNAESHMLARRAAQQTNPLAKIYFQIEARKLARLEKAASSRFQVHLTCSDLDSERLRASMSDARLVTIPNGVDTEYFKPLHGAQRPNSLVFVGTMNWYPNVDAMMFMLRDVWPILRHAVPDVTLDIIGSGVPDGLRELAHNSPGVTVHGFVKDIRSIVDSAALYVCPIRDGGGTKLKILDALSMAKCIVAHPIACEGIAVHDGETIALADSPESFCRQIARLLPADDERLAFGNAGRRLAETRYSFTEVARDMRRTLESLAEPDRGVGTHGQASATAVPKAG